jgi:Ribbon-helix-helix protein, copG family
MLLVVVQMRLSEQKIEIVRELARQENRSKSNMIRQLVIEALRARAGSAQPTSSA